MTLFAESKTVVLFEDDHDVRLAVTQALQLAGHTVAAHESADGMLGSFGPDFDGVVVSDIRIPGTDGRQIFRSLRQLDADIPVILITGHGELQEAVDLMREGVYDFISKPFSAPRLLASVRNALDQRSLVLDNRRLRAPRRPPTLPLPLLGESARIVQARSLLRDLADADVPVLLLGETGAGKEAAAHMLHESGRHRTQPFVVLDCAALPDHLLDTALFGSEGFVAGMNRRSPGRIEAADRGTLLLDNIDNLSLAGQAKLLRVVEDRKFTPPGSAGERSVSCRVVSTATRDVAKLVGAGEFRSDLFFRLNTVAVQLPSLRERREDIATLFLQLLATAAQRLKRPPPVLTKAVKNHLFEHSWPGNIRELSHFADRVVLGLDHSGDAGAEFNRDPLPEAVARFEASLIKDALRATGGSVNESLELLRIPRKTFYDKIARHGIDLDSFRAGR